MIGWILGAVGVLMGLIGGIYFIGSLVHSKGDLKSSLSYLVFASLLYVIFSGVMIYFGISQYEISNPLWELVPILYFVSSIFFAIGSVKLVRLFKRLK